MDVIGNEVVANCLTNKASQLLCYNSLSLSLFWFVSLFSEYYHHLSYHRQQQEKQHEFEYRQWQENQKRLGSVSQAIAHEEENDKDTCITSGGEEEEESLSDLEEQHQQHQVQFRSKHRVPVPLDAEYGSG